MQAFSKFHPLVLFAFFAAEFLFSMFLSNPLISFLALCGGGGYCLLCNMHINKRQNIWFYPVLFLLIVLSNPLISQNGVTTLFYWNGNAVTAESVLYGCGFATLLISVLLWGRAYSITVSQEQFLYLFGRPFPRLALLLSTAMRYVPLLRRQAQVLRRTQKAMGFYVSSNRAKRLQSVLRVYAALIGWSIEHAVETARSMRARGYGGARRTAYHTFRFTMRDAVALSAIFCICLLILVAAAKGLLVFSYYPRIRFAVFTPFSYTIYFLFAVLSFFPMIVEMKEQIQWKHCRSKI